MNLPRRHHTIPEFMLRHFTDSSGCTYYFRKTADIPGIIKARPRNLFVERDVNSTIDADGELDPALEKHLSKLDGLASATIAKVLDSIRGNQLPDLNSNDRTVLNYFVYRQWMRVSDVMGPILDSAPFALLVEDAKREAVSKGEEFSLSEEKGILADKGRLLHNARVQAMAEPSAKVMSMLEARGLTIFHLPSAGLAFVLGSNPVLKSTRDGKSDLRDLNVEVILSIAPDTALVLHGDSPNKFRVHPLHDRGLVREHNEAVFAQSSGTVSQSRQLLRSLARRFNYRI